MTASTIDEIRILNHRKGHSNSNGHRAKGSSCKACSKCSTSHPPRACPEFGRKCHKCGHKFTLVLVAGQKQPGR